MKAKIAAIKLLLQAANISGIIKRDIYVTEDIRLIRSAGGYPAIGIKDGRSNFGVEADDQDEVEQTITLAAYVQLLKPEAGIMGDGLKAGVLDVAAAIRALLRNNTLGGLADTARPISQGESELLTDGTLVITMVPVVMRYEKFD